MGSAQSLLLLLRWRHVDRGPPPATSHRPGRSPWRAGRGSGDSALPIEVVSRSRTSSLSESILRPARLASWLVTKLHHAAPVGPNVGQVEGNVFVKLVEE